MPARGSMGQAAEAASARRSSYDLPHSSPLRCLACFLSRSSACDLCAPRIGLTAQRSPDYISMLVQPLLSSVLLAASYTRVDSKCHPSHMYHVHWRCIWTSVKLHRSS